MNILSLPHLSASIVIGLQKGYSNKLNKKKDVRRVLQDFQYKLSKKKNIYLSACLSECEIILNGQVEPHIKVEFINYPRFPLEEGIFKAEVQNFTKLIMKELHQNRIVIIFSDEIRMLEMNEETDPRINILP